MEYPAASFETVATFVRNWHRLPARVAIHATTRFEADLGITGDDGVELVEVALEHFGIRLEPEGPASFRALFHLEPNEYLFNAEGFGPVWEVLSLFGASTVRSFTVGELYEALQRGQDISQSKPID